MLSIRRLLLLVIAALGATLNAASQENKAYLVSNAHFDSQWNWDVQTSIREYVRNTIDQNLFLLEKYPGYIFNFEGGIKYYWMKEYYPRQYELMKKYIADGRWHVAGSTWDANDPNIPSTESFTRNILYGQHFYRDEFGVEGTDIFLPDCFGFGWALPAVAAHSGLIGFSTQKLQWREKPFYGDSKIPFEIGLWQGVDGSRIMMVADGRNYTTKWRDEDLSRSPSLLKMTQESPIKTVYHYYGVGDRGGSPTLQSVKAVERSLRGDGPVKIISAASDQLYKDYLPFDEHPELPVWNGELLMDVHATGCYTSQGAMKLYNRRNEQLADAAERSAVAADWLGAAKYPRETLTEAWKRFIWHQFHDDLTGTSIPRAYEFSWNDELISMKQFADVTATSVGGVARALNTKVKGVPVVIYNPSGVAVSDVAELSLAGNFAKLTVYDQNNRPVRSQVLESGGGRTKILIDAHVPAMGYVVYDVRSGGGAPAQSSLDATEKGIENSVYKIAFDGNGDISSIIDKRNSKELVKEGRAIRLALFAGNESYRWPAWEILKKTIDAQPSAIGDNVRITVVENGPLRASVCVERSHEGSTFRQYVRLNEGGQADRIDIDNQTDWDTTDALLKAEFPLSVSNPKATYDIGVGSVQRGNNTDIAYEVYAQQWADLTGDDGGYGVTVISDSKYGWDKPDDNTLRLTLLHTPKTKGRYTYQDRQDFGRHFYRYSIMGHEGDYRKAGTVLKAEIMNQPLIAFVAPKHDGFLGREFSFARVENGTVTIKAVKQAEKSDGYVVRIYETDGRSPQSATIGFAADILSAEELNGVEDVIGAAAVSGNKLTFDVKPFGMKTFRVTLAAPKEKLAVTRTAVVALPYNMKAASYNTLYKEADFDGKGNSYPAELLPEKISYKGVEFELAPADAMNGMKCRGETISLPAGAYNKLYMLVASTGEDTKAYLTVDGKRHEIAVPHYGGFIGQWGHTGHTEAFLKPADVAFVATHRHNALEGDLPYEFAYMFFVGVDIPAGAKSVTLPYDPRVVAFAATVAEDFNNQTVPTVDLLRVGLPVREAAEAGDIRPNLVYGKPVIGRSGEVRESERAECATDENPDTKWCDAGEGMPKFIVVDLGAKTEIKGWRVRHAGKESRSYITKEYSLQARNSDGEDWKTVDTVSDNIDGETDRALSQPVKARYVRLLITKPDQRDGGTARIYEFALF